MTNTDPDDPTVYPSPSIRAECVAGAHCRLEEPCCVMPPHLFEAEEVHTQRSHTSWIRGLVRKLRRSLLGQGSAQQAGEEGF